MLPLHVGAVTFRPATRLDALSGLLGWASAEIGYLRICGIAVRRTRNGRRALTFPARTDRSGKKHAIVLPIDRELQQRIERAVIAELERQGALT